MAAAAVGATTALAAGPPAATAAAAAAAHAATAAQADPVGPFVLTGKSEITAKRSSGGYVNLRMGLTALAGPDGLEIRSTRADDYSGPITTTWTSGTRSGTLPVGTQKSFSGLPGFLITTYTSRRTGKVVRTKRTSTCLSGPGQRRSPDAAPRSPYPYYCPWNPYTLGSVQGLEGGWATNIEGWRSAPVRLPVGRYRVRVEVAPHYAEAFGLDAASSRHRLKLQVTKQRRRGGLGSNPFAEFFGRAGTGAQAPTPALRPTAESGEAAAAAPGPRPDLRSLPAWDIGLDRRGNLLRFAATVWNAGDSPLVIDGFRDQDEDEMDAYQYFFDTDGEQVGYEQIDSHFHWHAANHQHWHYEDFAAYRLLDANQVPVRTSGKISFCLANTDAVDYTVPGADWQPEGTDLSTACGRRGSLSIREVLSAGSGDTYAQYRAGQAIRVGDLPNGRYYLSVEANPYGKLVESDISNNNALRAISLRGPKSNRQVRVSKVGVIDENAGGGGFWFRPQQVN